MPTSALSKRRMSLGSRAIDVSNSWCACSVGPRDQPKVSRIGSWHSLVKSASKLRQLMRRSMKATSWTTSLSGQSPAKVALRTFGNPGPAPMDTRRAILVTQRIHEHIRNGFLSMDKIPRAKTTHPTKTYPTPLDFSICHLVKEDLSPTYAHNRKTRQDDTANQKEDGG
jgi:hypothetical protein